MTSDSRLRANLDVLAALEKDGTTSQLSLARNVSVAVGLVNALLRRAVRKGYVKVKEAPAKRYVYYLTPKGFSEKARLVTEYLDVSLDFFRKVQSEYVEILDNAHARGWRRIALVGAGELAEIAAIAATQTEVQLVGIVDTATNRTRFAGLDVKRSIDDIGEFDAVVVTDRNAPHETYQWLIAHVPRERVLAPAVLRIRALDAAQAKA